MDIIDLTADTSGEESFLLVCWLVTAIVQMLAQDSLHPCLWQSTENPPFSQGSIENGPDCGI